MTSQKHFELKPSVFIGLGGTGLQIGLQLKRLFMERFGDLQLDEHLQLPPIVRILVFDTADDRAEHRLETSEHQPVDLASDREFTHLKYNLTEIVPRLEELPYIQSWFPRNEMEALARDIWNINEGAPQRIRKFGRLGLFWYRDRIINKVQSAVAEVLDPTNQGQAAAMGFRLPEGGGIHFYVAGSLCGGTGSGTFIDLGYLLRQRIRQNQEDDRIFSFFVLPNAFKKDLGTAQHREVQANTYAALKELDSLMSGQTYAIDYGNNIRVEGTMKPFHFVYLMDAVNETGQFALQTVKPLTKVVGEAVFLHMLNPLTRAMVSRLRAAGEFLNKRVGGKQTNYSSLGMASRYIPYEGLRDYCTSCLCTEVLDCLLDPPGIATQPDAFSRNQAEKKRREELEKVAEDFLQDRTFDSLLAKLGSDPTAGDVDARIRLDVEQVTGIARKQLAGRIELVRANLTNQVLPQVRAQIDRNEREIVAELRKAVEGAAGGVCDEISRGPSFTLDLLTSLRETLSRYESLADEQATELDRVVADAEQRLDSRLEQLRTFVGSGLRWILQRGRRRNLLETVIREFNNIHLSRAKVYRTRALKSVCIAVRGEAEVTDRGSSLTQLIAQYRSLTRRLSNLKDEFDTKAQQSLPHVDPATLVFDRPIFEDRDFGRLFDMKVPDRRAQTETFLDYRGVRPPSQWSAEQPGLIKQWLTGYAEGVFSFIAGLTLEDGMTMKKEWGEEITHQALFKEMENAAVPWLQYVAGELKGEEAEDLPYPLQLLGVGDVETSPFANLPGTSEVSLASTRDPRGITMFITKHGISARAIKDLALYREAYRTALSPKRGENRRPLHLCPEFEYLEEPTGEQAVLRPFALGLALGVIDKTVHEGSPWLQFHAAGEARRLAGTTGPSGYADAFRLLMEQSILRSSLQQEVDATLTTGEQETFDKLRDFIDNKTGQHSMDPSLQHLVISEIRGFLQGYQGAE